ncbi:hypothetical protein BN12_660003 [Nostocoides japonicum T1-X7]|uniref:Uncharacterized protein n=1 Tax=Nostocoides japonicum T1-X7 TaxID=1194083 RepID=A0A077LXQ7_9MICO|nr:hypothetical protein BN12_320012 [Tetrasphaera japonica T1-X7]CCH79933.1 hypothetical protein BN12_660003 [Tetrasphaera japonica T1-X7]
MSTSWDDVVAQRRGASDGRSPRAELGRPRGHVGVSVSSWWQGVAGRIVTDWLPQRDGRRGLYDVSRGAMYSDGARRSSSSKLRQFRGSWRTRLVGSV